MTIHFTKMHALGNDFMVVNAVQQPITLTSSQIIAFANRHTGIGFDQCLIVEASLKPGVDFFYRIYNADGHEVGQCGNGARCLARFIQQECLSDKKNITVATRTTRMSLQINEDNTVTVDLGCPKWDKTLHRLIINQQPYDFYTIDLGNPHAVILSDDLHQAPVATLGKSLSTHPFFPHQCNIGFMHIINLNHIECRIYERGCGETLACGSGAVAAAAVGALHYGLKSDITVTLPGGSLYVQWPHREGSIFLTGGASFVYEGIIS